MIKWLKEHNCPWHITMFCELIKRGDLEILAWVYDNYQCHWDDTVCHTLSVTYNYSLKQWAISKGFPLDKLSIAL